MTRILSLAALSIVFAPSALACGMYMPDEVMLVDALEQIDAIDAIEVADIEVADIELAADRMPERVVQEAVETEDGDAVVDAADDPSAMETRRARRQHRKSRR